MYGKHKARGDAAKAAVTGTYKKSRTKGMDKPDPSRRGAAAYELLKGIRDARLHLKDQKEDFGKTMMLHKITFKKGWSSGPEERKDMNKDVKYGKGLVRDARRQVQALKQAYDKLSAAERAAGQKMFKKEQSK